MNKSQIFGTLCLLVTASIWGLAFVAQRNGMDSMGPCFFNASRSFLGMLCLLPVIAVLDTIQAGHPSIWGQTSSSEGKKHLIMGGIACGVVLGIASTLQQVGIQYCAVGKSGFLTALYIVIVPILGVFLKRKSTWLVWVSAFLALIGSYLLCGFSDDPMGIGDACLLSCAIMFSLHILAIDKFAPLVDCVRMSCIQFCIAGFITLFFGMIAHESFSFQMIRNAWIPIAFCGIGSSGIAYTLQIVGQKHVHPVVATLLMSLESVFSVLGGWWLLDESMTSIALCGCAVIFCAVILAQIPLPEKKKSAMEEA